MCRSWTSVQLDGINQAEVNPPVDSDSDVFYKLSRSSSVVLPQTRSLKNTFPYVLAISGEACGYCSLDSDEAKNKHGTTKSCLEDNGGLSPGRPKKNLLAPTYQDWTFQKVTGPDKTKQDEAVFAGGATPSSQSADRDHVTTSNLKPQIVVTSRLITPALQR
ncbi:hypothetical protein J6590_020722 [Homalodisca vitripennis]|nr:hypothetical protein J6590_020722 [Homalodisca vitripennis]